MTAHPFRWPPLPFSRLDRSRSPIYGKPGAYEVLVVPTQVRLPRPKPGQNPPPSKPTGGSQ